MGTLSPCFPGSFPGAFPPFLGSLPLLPSLPLLRSFPALPGISPTIPGVSPTLPGIFSHFLESFPHSWDLSHPCLVLPAFPGVSLTIPEIFSHFLGSFPILAGLSLAAFSCCVNSPPVPLPSPRQVDFWRPRPAGRCGFPAAAACAYGGVFLHYIHIYVLYTWVCLCK